MSEAVAAPPARRAWLVGPAADLLFGAGLAYGLVFLWLAVDLDGARRAVPFSALALLIVFVSMPHYGATLLRVYEHRRDRKAYAAYGLYATAALAALFVVGLHDPLVGSALFTLYLTWSPWHYTGQNYGIALLFLYRRGVAVPPVAKRALHASFVLSYVITFAFIHGGWTVEERPPAEIGFLSLGLDALAVDFFLFVVLLAYGYATARAVLALVRGASLRAAAPTLLLVAVQAVWFVLPAAYRNWFPYGRLESVSSREAAYFFTWVALGHAVQYLWVTADFARRSGRARATPPFLAKALLSGVALWTVPALLVHRGVGGPLPYDAGLAAVLAAVVNLHHFVLDGAIWRLRDAAVSGPLLRETESVAEKETERRAPWRKAGVAAATAAGLAAVAVAVFGVVEEHRTLDALGRRDAAAAEAGIERLGWIGRDSARLRTALAVVERDLGHRERAEGQLRASIAFYPTPHAWYVLGRFRARDGDPAAAAEAFGRALDAWPRNVRLRLELAEAFFALGEVDRARAILRQAMADAPEDVRLREAWERAAAR